jgi:AcrR family transcriptional regulator
LAHKNDLVHSVVMAEFFEFAPSKAQKRQIQIVESSIKLFATDGFDSTTYEKIAKKCGVTRPLVMHYFPEKEELLRWSIRYIRANLQWIAVEAIKKEVKPIKQLEAYVRSTFYWIKNFPEHARVWLLFYYHCGIDPKYNEINTELVSLGHERIKSLLGQMESRAHETQLYFRAKMIQNLITGSLLSALTERDLELKDLEEWTVAQVLEI